MPVSLVIVPDTAPDPPDGDYPDARPPDWSMALN
jgi:hypothetical protein